MPQVASWLTNERKERIGKDWSAFKERCIRERAREPRLPDRGQKIGKSIFEFWVKFKELNYELERMELLKHMAEIRYGHPKPEKLRHLRFKFNKTKRKFLKLKSRCRVCLGKKAEHRHHIIQLQFGGPNRGDNVIALCNSCHEKIHPWMVND